ncbi:winged helix DNA-binding domain-containing protein [Jatrophihabitans sp. DSM 45814]
MSKVAVGPVLTDLALNRALLARQGLLGRWHLPVTDAIERLVGLQSQAPNAPYTALWARLDSFDPTDLSTLMLDRQCVRIALMRSTIFLVTAQDCLRLRPVMQAASERTVLSNAGKRTQGIDLDRLLERADELFAEKPRTPNELGALLAPEFSDYLPADLASRVRVGLALVQVTPRGVWGMSGAPSHTTAERWLDRPLEVNPNPEDAILRYLAAFGPATVADIGVWSGLSGLRAPIDRLRPGLSVFRNERGQELFDVPDGLLPDPQTPAPVRILAEFDNILLSHADRGRIFDDANRMRFMSANGLIKSTFLVNGFVAGVCTVLSARSTATLTFRPFGELTKRTRSALASEGERLLEFLAPGRTHELGFDAAQPS